MLRYITAALLVEATRAWWCTGHMLTANVALECGISKCQKDNAILEQKKITTTFALLICHTFLLALGTYGMPN